MKNKNRICQSCGMPLDSPDIFGTEKNGSLSQEYCKNCYKDGAFINPALTMPGMKSTLRIEMGKQHIPSGMIERAVSVLPNLKRWRYN